MTTVVIDNYDSFTWNLVQLVGALGGRPVVYRTTPSTSKACARSVPPASSSRRALATRRTPSASACAARSSTS